MSADGWTRCPRCNATNDDQDPDSEYYGTVRVDHQFSFNKFDFEVSFWCTECDWSYELTHENVELPEPIDPKKEKEVLGTIRWDKELDDYVFTPDDV